MEDALAGRTLEAGVGDQDRRVERGAVVRGARGADVEAVGDGSVHLVLCLVHDADDLLETVVAVSGDLLDELSGSAQVAERRIPKTRERGAENVTELGLVLYEIQVCRVGDVEECGLLTVGTHLGVACAESARRLLCGWGGWVDGGIVPLGLPRVHYGHTVKVF